MAHVVLLFPRGNGDFRLVQSQATDSSSELSDPVADIWALRHRVLSLLTMP